MIQDKKITIIPKSDPPSGLGGGRVPKARQIRSFQDLLTHW